MQHIVFFIIGVRNPCKKKRLEIDMRCMAYVLSKEFCYNELCVLKTLLSISFIQYLLNILYQTLRNGMVYDEHIVIGPNLKKI